MVMGILAQLHFVQIKIMTRPNSLDMPLKRTKKVRLDITIITKMTWFLCSNVYSCEIFNSSSFLILDYRPGVGVVIEKGPHQDMCGKVISCRLYEFYALIQLKLIKNTLL